VLKGRLGEDACKNILFVHAILGCDTTSDLYGLGKASALKLLRSSKQFNSKARVFRYGASTKNEVIAAGEAALLLLYKEKHCSSLDSLPLAHFTRKVVLSKTFVDPKALPPTSSAAKFHSMRVYLQVQQWMENNQIKPDDWGWILQNGQYFPILTDKEVAPADLLVMIRCNCKVDCTTRRCTCRKNNLECSSACGQCRGVCSNVTSVMDDDEESELD
jgi:hypothetical protein